MRVSSRRASRPRTRGFEVAVLASSLLARAACQPAFLEDSFYASALPGGARRALPLLPLVHSPAPAPAGPPSSLFGLAVVDAANANSASPAKSSCASGFVDLEALKRAACSAPGFDPGTPRVDWDGFDGVYGIAGRWGLTRNDSTPDGKGRLDIFALANATDPTAEKTTLRIPKGCAFGCLPRKRSDRSPVSRVAGALPWRGKCFDALGKAEDARRYVRPTLADGSVADVSLGVVPLVARVANRIEAAPGPSAAGGVSERSVAPAAAYVGISAFDGLPAIIVDYRGQEQFEGFRDEIRHVGCGVWLGKTYLAGAPGTAAETGAALAASLAAAGDVELSPVVAAVIERAVPVREPGEPPPFVLDFTLYALSPEEEEEEEDEGGP
jgi:hypothetical protein